MELAPCNERHTKTREISSGRANIGQEELYFEDLGTRKENTMVDGVGESQAQQNIEGNIQLIEENLNKKGNPNMGRGHNNIEGAIGEIIEMEEMARTT